MNRANRGVVAGQQPGKAGLVHHVAPGRRDVGSACDLFGMAGNGGHGVAAAGELSGDARTGIAGRADDGDFHGSLPCDTRGWYTMVTR